MNQDQQRFLDLLAVQVAKQGEVQIAIFQFVFRQFRALAEIRQLRIRCDGLSEGDDKADLNQQLNELETEHAGMLLDDAPAAENMLRDALAQMQTINEHIEAEVEALKRTLPPENPQ